MSKVTELRQRRAKVWEDAKAFLDSHRKNGILSAEDTATYEKMEKEIVDLGHEIERQERMDALEREMNTPLGTPITSKPGEGQPDKKNGRASDAYRQAFWNQMRDRSSAEVRNALSEGVDSDGGFLVPETFETNLITGLNDLLFFRQLAHTFTTSSASHAIPIATTRGAAIWADEGSAIPESNDSFGQKIVGAHKLTALIKVSEELLNDAAFDLEGYFRSDFARRMAEAEETAFIAGDGNHKPTGIFHATDGAQLGVTTASATAIKADEVIDLYYALRSSYRSKAVWLLNDTTISAIRKLKDNNGQFMWQTGLRDGEPDKLLGKPVYTSDAVPCMAAGSKAIAFGDLSYYWIGDRQGVTFKRLNELYASTGQIGFLATKRVDGKLIIPEAVKTLQMKSGS